MGVERYTVDDLFQCTQCGDCCSGYGGTYVTHQDIKRIADFIQSDPGTVIAHYCDRSGSRLVLSQAENGTCIFFKENCSIHPVKPYMCRAWPFIKTIINNPENWDAMANSCPGIKKGIPQEILKAVVLKETQKLDDLYCRLCEPNPKIS